MQAVVVADDPDLVRVSERGAGQDAGALRQVPPDLGLDEART